MSPVNWAVPRRINVTDYNALIQMAECKGLKERMLLNRKGAITCLCQGEPMKCVPASHLFHTFRELTAVLP